MNLQLLIFQAQAQAFTRNFFLIWHKNILSFLYRNGDVRQSCFALFGAEVHATISPIPACPSPTLLNIPVEFVQLTSINVEGKSVGKAVRRVPVASTCFNISADDDAKTIESSFEWV